MGEAPWRLRGFTVERLIGVGASGDVWRARTSQGGEPVALKRVRVTDPAQAARAQSEAALLCALDHPHIVRLHALTQTDDVLVLVLDLAGGGSLAELLAARGRLTPGEVITAMAPVAAALAYLHDEGVVHGDVSAANILFTPAGVSLLADVGVARLRGDDRAAVSTPAYVDPAVAAGCVPGPRSDVFMLAAVALHALTGTPVWPGATGDEALALAAAGCLDDIESRLAAAQVPDVMARVIVRGLHPDPHHRGTAADLALDLRHSGEPVAVELAAGGRRPGVQPAADPPRGPRHAARLGPPGRSAASGRAAGAAPFDRPAFDRPSVLPGGVGIAPPTRQVGPRPRPVVPRPNAGHRRHRALLVALTLAALALLATAGTVWASTSGRSPAPPHPVDAGSPGASGPGATSSVARSARARSSAAKPSAAKPSATSTPRTRSVSWPTRAGQVEWSAVLTGLDALRARAFATRDTGLLTRVYASAALRSSDAALLLRIVPSGCSLAGAITRYPDVEVRTAGTRVVLTATAVLPRSILRCPGQHDLDVRGAGPTRLRITLEQVAGTALISDQRAA